MSFERFVHGQAKRYGDVITLLKEGKRPDYVSRERDLFQSVASDAGGEELSADKRKKLERLRRHLSYEPSSTRGSRARDEAGSTPEIISNSASVLQNITPETSGRKDRIREVIEEARIRSAVTKQEELDRHEQAFVQLIDSCLEGSIKADMLTHTAYQDAYMCSDLVEQWKELKNYSRAGNTANLKAKLELNFYKLIQQKGQSFEDYVIEFESRLNHLLENKVEISESKLRDVFISGLSDIQFGEYRDGMELRREQLHSMDMEDEEYPKTWVMAKERFRTVARSTSTRNDASNKPSMSALVVESDIQDMVRRTLVALSMESGNPIPHAYSASLSTPFEERGKKGSPVRNTKTKETDYLSQTYKNLKGEWVKIPPEVPVQEWDALGKMRYISLQQRQVMALTREKRKANYVKWKQDQTQRGNDSHVLYADLPDDGTEDDNLITEDAYVEVYILEKAKYAAGEYLIFDPGATDSVITQRNLLSVIHPIKHARIKGVGGDIIMKEEGTMGIYGP